MYLDVVDIIGPITDIEIIAAGPAVRQISRLRRQYGRGRWRKLKGIATVRTVSGALRRAEVHWYEAHGIGRVRHKIKRFVD
jgi:hypothetical protein